MLKDRKRENVRFVNIKIGNIKIGLFVSVCAIIVLLSIGVFFSKQPAKEYTGTFLLGDDRGGNIHQTCEKG